MERPKAVAEGVSWIQLSLSKAKRCLHLQPKETCFPACGPHGVDNFLIVIAERAGHICSSSMGGCIKAGAVLGLHLCARGINQHLLAIRHPAGPAVKDSAFSLPHEDGFLCCGDALCAAAMDVEGKVCFSRMPFIRCYRAAASEMDFVKGFNLSSREQS